MRKTALALAIVFVSLTAAAAADDQSASGHRIAPLAPGAHSDYERRTALFELRALRRKSCMDAADTIPRKQALDRADTAMRVLEYMRLRLQTGTGPDDFERLTALLEQMQELDFLWKTVHDLPDCPPATGAPPSLPARS